MSSNSPDEDSCCESDENYSVRMENEESLSRQRKNENLKINQRRDLDDETESNLNFEEQAIYSSTPSTSPISLVAQDKMRRRLQFFFMNPIEKWQAKRRFPYKFVVQVIKIILVTMQLCLFAHSRYQHVNYTWDNKVAFSHLFLKGWDASLEAVSYPPTSGPLSVYIVPEFFDTIDYAVNGYKNLSIAIGPYSYPNDNNTMGPVKICLYQYRNGTIFGFNESYIFDPQIDSTCVTVNENDVKDGIQSYFHSKEIFIQFSALVKATVEFSIKTVNLKASGPMTAPDCYQFDITILFNNEDHDGQMLLSLEADPTRLICQGDVEFIKNDEIDTALRSILNILVILICAVSFGLCTRAIYRAQLLRLKTSEFFYLNFGKDLSSAGKMEFLNMWYIMIICNDILLIIGSALKEEIERKHFAADEWNNCSLFLGIGNLLVWIGVLRYLGFFKTYNVVILTLHKAAPQISRFLLCALLIYAGFTFCGWLVLSPYHIKFRSLSTTSECLFSLINGDDMFATFSIMSEKSMVLWWFCRIYLYSFISLYIYVVLSLFISVIMDSYDTIKMYYNEGFPINDLRKFMGEWNMADFANGAFRDEKDDDDSIGESLKKLFCFWRTCRRAENPGPTGYTSLSQPSI